MVALPRTPLGAWSNSAGEGPEGAQWWSCRCQPPSLLAPKESGQLWFTKSAEEPGGHGGVCYWYSGGVYWP